MEKSRLALFGCTFDISICGSYTLTFPSPNCKFSLLYFPFSVLSKIIIFITISKVQNITFNSLISSSFPKRRLFSSDILCSITDTVSRKDYTFAVDASSPRTRKFYYLWKDFLKTRQVSSDLFYTVFLILGRKKRDFSSKRI